MVADLNGDGIDDLVNAYRGFLGTRIDSLLLSPTGAFGNALVPFVTILGLQVALRPDPQRSDGAPDVRAYALNAASVALLRSLKVWDALPPHAATAVHDMHIEGDTPGAALDFSAWEQCVGELAWIVDAAVVATFDVDRDRAAACAAAHGAVRVSGRLARDQHDGGGPYARGHPVGVPGDRSLSSGTSTLTKAMPARSAISTARSRSSTRIRPVSIASAAARPALMTSSDKKGLAISLTGMTLMYCWFHLKSWHDWNGPVSTATGAVISCTSRYSSDDGMVYTTTYSFKDEAGRDWTTSTAGIRYCLPPRSLLKFSWPEKRPELAYAEELRPAQSQ
jgi:hypothetical protein